MIEAPALSIEEPSPFVEIAAHVSDMYPEHVFIFIGFARVGMRDAPFRIIERQVIPMNSTGKIDILRIHEIAFVEKTGLHGSRSA